MWPGGSATVRACTGVCRGIITQLVTPGVPGGYELGNVERVSLVSLYGQRAYGNQQGTIIAAVLLTLAAATGPALALARTIHAVYPLRGESGSDASASAAGEANSLPRLERASLAEPETGKTGTEG